MLFDDIKITVAAGNGGDGATGFSRTKGMKGPTGGNGGRGGSVFIEGISDLGALRQFRFKKDFEAEKGENGKNSLNDGHNAQDLILFVPIGTVCHNRTTGKDIEITKLKQRELIAQGGRGGKGNWFFRSSINTSPKQFEKGEKGEVFNLELELKMIADVGFIGLPNVGKSSFINELTNAQSKVGNYPFTTLEPNLGAYNGLILADNPGLIEGASNGKGLGIKFLRHIERAKVLFHFISADSKDPVKDYKTVRAEMAAHNKSLLEKKEHIFASKSDLIDKKEITEMKKNFKKIKKDIIPVSIIDPNSIDLVKKILDQILKEKSA